MKYIFLFFIFLCGTNLFAQVPPGDSTGGETFGERMPEFPGGDSAFHVFLKNNIQYPDSALKYKREGTVFVYFEVAKDGTCANFAVKRGVPNAPELSAEALRVMALMPKWSPAEMNGKPVKVAMTVPIKFTLH